MTEAIQFKWHGSSDPNDESGRAVFGVGDSNVTVELSHFVEARSIHLLLLNAYETGQGVGLEKAKRAVNALRIG